MMHQFHPRFAYMKTIVNLYSNLCEISHNFEKSLEEKDKWIISALDKIIQEMGDRYKDENNV